MTSSSLPARSTLGGFSPASRVLLTLAAATIAIAGLYLARGPIGTLAIAALVVMVAPAATACFVLDGVDVVDVVDLDDDRAITAPREISARQGVVRPCREPAGPHPACAE